MNRELMSNNNSGCYKQIYLCRFINFDDTVKARKEAEKIYFR